MNFAACFFVGGVVMTFFSFECKLSNLRSEEQRLPQQRLPIGQDPM